MKIDDLPFSEKPSKINDPYLQKVIEGEKYMDLMEFVKVPKPELPVDIQKTHDMWIPQVLHIVHKLCPIEFLFTVVFS